jgi:hypothetical protein
MEIAFCCLWLTAMTLAGTDLVQTAEFTRNGDLEINPLVRSIVEGDSNLGEIGLGVASVASYWWMDRHGGWQGRVLLLLSVAGHGWAVMHNENNGWKVSMVVFPTLTIRW